MQGVNKEKPLGFYLVLCVRLRCEYALEADHQLTFEEGVLARGFTPTNKQGGHFTNQNAVHDIEQIKHKLFPWL